MVVTHSRILCLLLVLAGCKSESSKEDWTISIRGYGPIETGMTLAEASAAASRSFGKPDMGSAECDYVQFDGDTTRALNFMLVEGRIARVDIHDSTIATNHGARIGDSEARIEQLYAGRVTSLPHKYVDGHYLVVGPASPADSGNLIIFETDGNKVTTYRTGRVPEVEFVEGCS